MVYMITNNTLEIDMKLNEINWALKDIQETLSIWRDEKEWNDPYIVKLYREFDKLIVMKQKIMEKR
jgi:hypothetical protein